MLDNFNINVTHFIPTPTPVPSTDGGIGTPDTGFFSNIYPLVISSLAIQLSLLSLCRF